MRNKLARFAKKTTKKFCKVSFQNDRQKSQIILRADFAKRCKLSRGYNTFLPSGV